MHKSVRAYLVLSKHCSEYFFQNNCTQACVTSGCLASEMAVGMWVVVFFVFFLQITSSKQMALQFSPCSGQFKAIGVGQCFMNHCLSKMRINCCFLRGLDSKSSVCLPMRGKMDHKRFPDLHAHSSRVFHIRTPGRASRARGVISCKQHYSEQILFHTSAMAGSKQAFIFASFHMHLCSEIQL